MSHWNLSFFLPVLPQLLISTIISLTSSSQRGVPFGIHEIWIECKLLVPISKLGQYQEECLVQLQAVYGTCFDVWHAVWLQQASKLFLALSLHTIRFDFPRILLIFSSSSILHYSPQAFAIDRTKPTLIPRYPAKNMGQREGKELFPDFNPTASI